MNAIRRPSTRPFVPFLVAVAISLGGCNHTNPKVPAAAGDAKRSGSVTQEAGDLNRQIMAALQGRRYADAVALARRAKVSQAEADFAVGEIILQGHEDAVAAQAPRESIEEGLMLIETSALAGHQQAIASLAATFHTGLPGTGAADAFLLGPDARLAQCWEDAKDKPTLAPSCVYLRRKH